VAKSRAKTYSTDHSTKHNAKQRVPQWPRQRPRRARHRRQPAWKHDLRRGSLQALENALRGLGSLHHPRHRVRRHRHPLRASATARLRPMPDEAPVTNALTYRFRISSRYLVKSAARQSVDCRAITLNMPTPTTPQELRHAVITTMTFTTHDPPGIEPNWCRPQLEAETSSCVIEDGRDCLARTSANGEGMCCSIQKPLQPYVRVQIGRRVTRASRISTHGPPRGQRRHPSSLRRVARRAPGYRSCPPKICSSEYAIDASTCP